MKPAAALAVGALLRQCEAQGLPLTISDHAALSRMAGAVSADLERRPTSTCHDTEAA